jgi:ABC-2 type transport system ATP-binding protein
VTDPRSQPAVSIRDLHVRFGDTIAVEAMDLDVCDGEVLGLLGPNGAGKTTAIRVITTLLPATSGSAHVFGIDVARRPMDVRRLLEFVSQRVAEHEQRGRDDAVATPVRRPVPDRRDGERERHHDRERGPRLAPPRREAHAGA